MEAQCGEMQRVEKQKAGKTRWLEVTQGEWDVQWEEWVEAGWVETLQWIK